VRLPAIAVVAVALLATPATADPIGTLQAQADRLAAQISSAAERVGALTTQYNQAAASLAAVSSQLASAQTDLVAIRHGIGAATDVLRHEAITAYMGTDAGRSPMATVGGMATDLVLRRQYLQVANGNIADSLDRFHAGVGDLQAHEVSLRRDQAAVASAAAKVTEARRGALAAAADAERALAQVHGQLAQLVVQAEAAKAAKAAKAVASSAPQGLPVNGGLAAVVASAVAAPAAPAPAPVVTIPVPAVTAPRPTTPPQSTAPPATAPPATPAVPVVTGGAGGVWAALRQCESGGNYAENTGNGYYGAYQFSQATWSSLGYPGRPDQAPPAMQDEAAQRLQARSGWGQWPACSAALGLH
jgi:hypothetical protein